MAEVAIASRVPSDRAVILASLIALASAAWGLLIWQSVAMGNDMSLTMGMGAPLFIALWVAMMVAIMYPTAAPMIMAFARIHNHRRERGRAFVPTWVFAGSYMALWSATGLLAYGIAVGGDHLASQSAWLSDNAARLGGGLLIVAGLYQLTPLKEICLSKCRTPMSFLMNNWREGLSGAVHMGLEHATYCLGCCWLLFLIIFPLGMMNIGVLALITILIFSEKVLPIGRQVAYAAGTGLVIYGAVVIFVPAALPITMSDSQMSQMPGDAPRSDGMATIPSMP